MTKPQPAVEAVVGLDVSAREIKVARVEKQGDNPVLATFGNNASGHKALLAFALERTERVKVCLEASGNYSLDLALTLHAHGQVDVSVVNPRRARKFAESLASPIPLMLVYFANTRRACLGNLGIRPVQRLCVCAR
jgi:transposase